MNPLDDALDTFRRATAQFSEVEVWDKEHKDASFRIPTSEAAWQICVAAVIGPELSEVRAAESTDPETAQERHVVELTLHLLDLAADTKDDSYDANWTRVAYPLSGMDDEGPTFGACYTFVYNFLINHKEAGHLVDEIQPGFDPSEDDDEEKQE